MTSKYVKYRNKVKQYCWNHLIAFDQWINVWLGGDPDETISSRMGKRPRGSCPVCYWVCWALDKIDKDHCQKVIEHDRGSRNVVKF